MCIQTCLGIKGRLFTGRGREGKILDVRKRYITFKGDQKTSQVQ